MFTVATWNINSIRLRAALVARLLTEQAPDILCLQECKSPVDKMPLQLFHDMGYRWSVARGQRGYNGVAILSRTPLRDVVHGIPGFDDEQKRVIAATGHGLAHGLCPFGWIVAVGCPYPYCDGHDDGHGHKDP